jgi:hypothetical protein
MFSVKSSVNVTRFWSNNFSPRLLGSLTARAAEQRRRDSRHAAVTKETSLADICSSPEVTGRHLHEFSKSQLESVSVYC